MGCKINDLNYVINNKLGVNEFFPKNINSAGCLISIITVEKQ